MDSRHTLTTVGLALCIAMPGLAQCPAQRLTETPDFVRDFGFRIAITDNQLVLSAGYHSTGLAVRVYQREDELWEHLQTIQPNDAGFGDDFGASIDLQGDRMIVSSPFRSRDGRLGRFHVFSFNPITGLWVEREHVSAPGLGEPSKGFGFPIVSSGDMLLASHGDLIHRYTEDAEGWQYQDTFGPPDGLAPRSNFGRNIGMSEEWVFISADQDSTLDPRHGSVYVYRRNPDNTLSFVEKLLPPDLGLKPALEFGWDMSFDGRTLAVSSPSTTRDHLGQGVVYIYELREGRWTPVQELTHSDAGTLPVFGQGVHVKGDTLVAGTREVRRRVSYVFRRGPDGVWREVAVLRPDGVTPDGWIADGFGFRHAVDGDRVVVGATNEGQTSPPFAQSGAVYAFDLSCEICQADLDHDGVLTIFDYLLFFNLFNDGDLLADFDGDGELTIFDFLAFQTAFAAGCE